MAIRCAYFDQLCQSMQFHLGQLSSTCSVRNSKLTKYQLHLVQHVLLSVWPSQPTLMLFLWQYLPQIGTSILKHTILWPLDFGTCSFHLQSEHSFLLFSSLGKAFSRHRRRILPMYICELHAFVV